MDKSCLFEKRVLEYICKYQMVPEGVPLFVGVSGGADSVCLLSVLHSFFREEQNVSAALNMPAAESTLTAVHIHHGIRGAQADADEDFVRGLCADIGVPCRVFHVNVPEEMEKTGEGCEEAARRLRYQVFSQILLEFPGGRLALAHHREDQAETVLFHAIRGSSLRGLSGMRPVNGNYIRPLLFVQKEEICQYLSQKNIAFRTDQTNFSLEYTRNRLRLQVMPQLLAINAKAVENISRAADSVQLAEDFLSYQETLAWQRLFAGRAMCGCEEVLLPGELLGEHPFLQERLVYRALSEISGGCKDLQKRHVQAVLALFEKQPGRMCSLPKKIMAQRQYGGVRLYKKADCRETDWSQPLFCVNERQKITEMLSSEGLFTCCEGNLCIEAIKENIHWRVFLSKKNIKIPKNNYTKWFDYDKISTAALFRTRRAGDFFVMDSSGGHKKLKQYFIDAKIPQQQRDQVLLLADNSHIIWIADGRISEEYKVQKNTRVILELETVKK